MNKNKNYIIVSKDAMCTDYLKCYTPNGIFQDTPNIDDLAKKGTVFTNYYSAGASTVMAFFSMCTGKYSFQSDMQIYERKSKPYNEDTIFSKLKENGYTQLHIIWSDGWEELPEYEDYFHNDVELHTINHLRSLVVGKNVSEDSNVDEQLAEQFLHKIEKIIVDILAKGERTFIWLHLPHVIAGRAGYGSDMDLFDRYVGMVRKYFQDDEITITADHGNMNGHRGKLAYAYDVYDPVVRIPFIRPRVGGMHVCKDYVSSTQFYNLIFEDLVPKEDFIYSETAYKAQKHRKLAILYKGYKYIYNKADNTEELYDMELNPEESLSLVSEKIYDPDRKINVYIRNRYYYPKWKEAHEAYKVLHDEKERIWQNGDLKYVLQELVKSKLRPLKDAYIQFKFQKGE